MHRRRLLVVVSLLALLASAIPLVEAAHRPPARLLVGLHEGASAPGVGERFHGGRVVEENGDAGYVIVESWNAGAFKRFAARNGDVRYVEADRPDAMRSTATPNDPRYPDQYALARIRAPAAWDATMGDPGIVIAIVDSGVDASHPDLTRALPGRDFTGSGSLDDSCGHGTHVAGIAAATANNREGIAGVAQASLLPVKVLANSWNGCVGSFSAIANGITWAADQGADVISMSLGCAGCTSQAVADAIRYATGTKGALVVAAAGNGGPCSDCVSYPATLPEAVAVGCTTSTDALCRYSSTGSEVELAAPGDSVLSTYPDGRYALLSGTSMSTPHVAGVAALALSANPGLTGSEVRSLLQRTARDLGSAGRDASFGFGIVDADAAVQAAGGGSGNARPTARFTASASGLALDVDGTASSDSDGRVAAWRWSWGDGTADGSGSRASHAYAREGTYTVTLTVTDDDGATGTASASVRVVAGGALFASSFDDGRADGWTLSGLWRVGSDCGGGRSPDHALQHNRAGACTYATGARTTGSATFRVDLTEVANPTLAFSHRHEVERTASGSYDIMRVLVSMNGGSSWRSLWQRDSRHATVDEWIDVELDLTRYRSSNAVIRFTFDSRDASFNGYRGWAIDDVRVR